MSENPIILGFVGSLAAGLATGIGTLPAIFLRTVSARIQSALLGGAAGVMLAAVSFSLVIPGISAGEPNYGSFSVVAVGLGLVLGAVFLDLVDRFVPHEHFQSGKEGPSSKVRRIWLFIYAITLHNFPEGLSVGVGFAGEDMGKAVSLATGIGIQNIPEGLAVTLPLIGLGYSRSKAMAIGLASGLVEPVGGLLGATLVTLFNWLLPWAMGFAAGAMLFVISDEVIPETHRAGYSNLATFGVITGFVLMMLLDNLLG